MSAWTGHQADAILTLLATSIFRPQADLAGMGAGTGIIH